MSSEHMVVIGDCRRMKEIKTSSVQLIITNPPLFFSKCNFSNSGLPQDFESYVKELRRVFKECNRVLEAGLFYALKKPKATCDFIKGSRKFGASIGFITQELEDLLSTDGGRSILNQTATKLLMRQNTTNS